MKNRVRYDINWLVELLEEQYPEKNEIIENLKDCKEGSWQSKAYIYFISPDNPNQPDSKWQFKESIVLEHKTEGTIVLDVLKENKIGGIEFLKYLA